MTKPASLIDSTKDAIEKFTGATHRAGASVQRAYALVEAGVDPAVAALQMSKNSPTDFGYTPEFVRGLHALYRDCQSKVVITSAQASALIDDQNAGVASDGNLVFG